jgi:thioredoxin-like negative regulator of GroEL
VAPNLQDAAAHPELWARLDRFVAAFEPIRRGHTHLRRLELAAAAAAYLEAQAICPEDESLEFLLSFDDLRRRAANDPYDGWSRLNLAEIALARGLVNEAGEWFRQVYQLTDQRDEPRARSLFSRSVVGLAECLRRVGEVRSAQHLLERHAAQVEGQPGLAELRAALAGG